MAASPASVVGVDGMVPGQGGSDRGVITGADAGEPAPRHCQQPRLPAGDLLRRPLARLAGHRLQARPQYGPRRSCSLGHLEHSH